jgi:pimeloyl-ACP methyl ester carboxylesterase
MKKLLVKTLCFLAPNQMVKIAYDRLANPQITKLRPHEIKVLEAAEKTIFSFKGFDIQTYTWPGGNDQVLLIHGWEGQAGNFADLIEQLIAQNYTVHAFDGPSHGFSSRGRTSLFEFTELVGILIRKFGVCKLVSHSFGGVATTYALFCNPDLHIERYVLLTTPDKFSERIQDVADQVGITEKVKQKLIHRLEIETGENVSNFNVSEFVKTIDVAQALIIHDKNDTVIPIHRSKNVYQSWKVCEFWEIEGTGHFRILRTEVVLQRVLEFLALEGK